MKVCRLRERSEGVWHAVRSEWPAEGPTRLYSTGCGQGLAAEYVEAQEATEPRQGNDCARVGCRGRITRS
jgi:hypothetical protein